MCILFNIPVAPAVQVIPSGDVKILPFEVTATNCESCHMMSFIKSPDPPLDAGIVLRVHVIPSVEVYAIAAAPLLLPPATQIPLAYITEYKESKVVPVGDASIHVSPSSVLYEI